MMTSRNKIRGHASLPTPGRQTKKYLGSLRLRFSPQPDTAGMAWREEPYRLSVSGFRFQEYEIEPDFQRPSGLFDGIPTRRGYCGGVAADLRMTIK